MGNLSKYKLPRKNGGRLLIVIAAVLLLELLSVAQYYLTHNLLEEELEKRAELELTMKTIILKKIIDDSERTLKSHIMEVKYNLSTPDSLYNIMKQFNLRQPELYLHFFAEEDKKLIQLLKQYSFKTNIL